MFLIFSANLVIFFIPDKKIFSPVSAGEKIYLKNIKKDWTVYFFFIILSELKF